MAQGLSGSTGNFLDQALTPCLLHWQADSLSLSHQGSPEIIENAHYMVAFFCLFDKLEISYIQSPTFFVVVVVTLKSLKAQDGTKPKV